MKDRRRRRIAAAKLLAGGDASPLLNGLFAYYSMEQPSGDRADISGGGRALTDVNTSGSAPGIIGNAVRFVQVNQERLIYQGPMWASVDRFTISCWVKGSHAPAAAEGFVGLGGPGTWTNGSAGALYTNDGSQLSGLIGNDGEADFSLNQKAINLVDGSWHHCVGRFNRVTGLVELAADNSWDKVNSSTCTTPTTNDPSVIGVGIYHPAASGVGDFDIDEVAIWCRHLTDAEVTALYNSGAGLAYPFT